MKSEKPGAVPIAIAVIGVGNLGQHHARIYKELEDVNLAAVVDVNPKRMEKISSRLNVYGCLNFQEILDKVDAVSIAVPTELHYEIGKQVISHGIHCLIEKPLTANLVNAEELISLAQKKNVVLQVGHIERFNPAVLSAQPYIKNPRFIEAYRLGPYDPRVKEGGVGVVLDLMIHDLDIILYLLGNSTLKHLEAHGARVLSPPPQEDIVKVRLKFDNGCVADLSASRVSLEKYRKIRIFQSDGYISLDYAAQNLKIYKKKKSVIESMKDIEIIHPHLDKVEPLKLELSHFVNCIQEGRKPHVTGKHGRDAIELALEILKKLEKYE